MSIRESSVIAVKRRFEVFFKELISTQYPEEKFETYWQVYLKNYTRPLKKGKRGLSVEASFLAFATKKLRHAAVSLKMGEVPHGMPFGSHKPEREGIPFDFNSLKGDKLTYYHIKSLLKKYVLEQDPTLSEHVYSLWWQNALNEYKDNPTNNLLLFARHMIDSVTAQLKQPKSDHMKNCPF